MKERGQYQIQFLKTRSSSGVGSKVPLGFDPNTLRIFNLDDEAQALTGASTNTADVFADLRRKNAVAAKKSDAQLPTSTSDVSKNIKDLEGLRALVRR
jgi:hypothetical protein